MFSVSANINWINRAPWYLNSLNDAYMRPPSRPSLVQIIACHLFGAKPLSEPTLAYYQMDLRKIFQWNLNKNTSILIRENAFENTVRKMAAILSRPQCVKPNKPYAYCTECSVENILETRPIDLLGTKCLIGAVVSATHCNFEVVLKHRVQQNDSP